MTPDALPRAAKAEHLTAALRRSGALGAARVADVAVMSSLKKLRSHTLRLRLDYDGAAGDAPTSVILKMGHVEGTGRSSYANSREIAFYRDVAPAMPATLVPRCFAVADATDADAWHLLLEDLTDTHFIATEWPLPPTLRQYEQIVRTQARFHAAWWDNPLLGVSVGTWRDADALNQEVRGFSEQFARFTDRFGELLPPERRALYERLLDQAPRLLARYRSRRDLSIIHGDAHPWNFFLPRDGVGENARLIDWEGWSIDAATDDLAYMMAMHWYPDRRQRLERRLLDLYHVALLADGVTGYDRQALDDDYRLSVLWSTTRPIAQAMNKFPRACGGTISSASCWRSTTSVAAICLLSSRPTRAAQLADQAGGEDVDAEHGSEHSRPGLIPEFDLSVAGVSPGPGGRDRATGPEAGSPGALQ